MSKKEQEIKQEVINSLKDEKKIKVKWLKIQM